MLLSEVELRIGACKNKATLCFYEACAATQWKELELEY